MDRKAHKAHLGMQKSSCVCFHEAWTLAWSQNKDGVQVLDLKMIQHTWPLQTVFFTKITLYHLHILMLQIYQSSQNSASVASWAWEMNTKRMQSCYFCSHMIVGKEIKVVSEKKRLCLLKAILYVKCIYDFAVMTHGLVTLSCHQKDEICLGFPCRKLFGFPSNLSIIWTSWVSKRFLRNDCKNFKPLIHSVV